MHSALAGSRVKVHGRDVVASVVISRAVTATPVVVLVYAILGAVVLAVLWIADDAGISPGAHAAIVVAAFLALLVFVVFPYMLLSQRVLSTALDLCRQR